MEKDSEGKAVVAAAGTSTEDEKTKKEGERMGKILKIVQGFVEVAEENFLKANGKMEKRAKFEIRKAQAILNHREKYSEDTVHNAEHNLRKWEEVLEKVGYNYLQIQEIKNRTNEEDEYYEEDEY